MEKKPMPKRLISLTRTQLGWLRKESARLGITVSALIRLAVDAFQLKHQEDRRARTKRAEAR